MDPTLINFVDLCLGIAVVRELDASNDINIKIANPDGSTGEYLIVCSFDEPTGVLPLNVLWIDSDPTSDDYKQMYKRTSKTSQGGYNNTWAEIDNIVNAFNDSQYYDSGDLPTVESAVSDMENHLLNQLPDFDPHGIKAFVASEVKTSENDIFSFMIYVNQKVDNNKRAIDELIKAKDTHHERITVLENKSGLPKFKHVQQEPATSWTIEHNLDSSDLIVKYIDAEGEIILPDTELHFEGNILHVSFAQIAVSGRALILGL